MKKTIALLAAIPLVMGSASALELKVDEILYQNGAGLDTSKLSPSIFMDLNGNILTITLQNNSDNAAGDAALVLLTGLSFRLPNQVSVFSPGSVTPGPGSTTGKLSTSWTFAGAQDGWGYDYAAGGISGGALAYSLLGGYNTAVSTLASNGKNAFDGSGNAGGIDYGIFSKDETSTTPSPWVKDTLVITLNLNLGSYNGSLLDDINRGNVAAFFGSPNAVPDGGTTLMLLGLGVGSLGLIRRKLK